jgi:flagellar biosynthesis component FlhA
MKKEVFLKNVNEKDPAKSYFEKVEMAGGFVIGHTADKKALIFELAGTVQFDDAVDDIMSAIYHMCAITWIENKNSEPARDEIYKRVVQAFSLIMDKFHPKMKDQRTDIMTDDELKRIEELVKKDADNKQG